VAPSPQPSPNLFLNLHRLPSSPSLHSVFTCPSHSPGGQKPHLLEPKGIPIPISSHVMVGQR
jgi:hypothetical protein